MAIITRQGQIFEWEELEILGDLERLRLVKEHLPDEKLMQHLERESVLEVVMITRCGRCGT